MKRAVERQMALPLRSWGGKRRGAGRKANGRPGTKHRKRRRFGGARAVHLTLRLRGGLPNLRIRQTYEVLKESFAIAVDRLGMRLIHYSVQTNHIHLIVEAHGWEALWKAVTGLETRLARALNAWWKRTGPVLGDRYHAHLLNTPTEARNAVFYVLQNAARHTGRPLDWVDPYSSAARWVHPPPVAPPTVWILRNEDPVGT